MTVYDWAWLAFKVWAFFSLGFILALFVNYVRKDWIGK